MGLFHQPKIQRGPWILISKLGYYGSLITGWVGGWERIIPKLTEMGHRFWQRAAYRCVTPVLSEITPQMSFIEKKDKGKFQLIVRNQKKRMLLILLHDL